MTRPLSVIAIALIGVIMASVVLAQNRDNGNGAKVGKDGFMLNVIANFGAVAVVPAVIS